MIIIMNPKATEEEVRKVKSVVEGKGLETNLSKGDTYFIIGIIGDTSVIDPKKLQVLKGVDRVMKVQEPYKKANRIFKPEDTIVKVENSIVGGGHLGIMAGPCSVESEEQIVEVAKRVKKAGANFLRGGAFKPRTSPYSFQGLELEGLKLLKIAKEETGLPIVTELMSTDYLDTFVEEVDMIQIGARNMQNFDLLKQVGRTKKPVLLKRGLSSTITRNTLDLQAVPVIKKLSHLPIIIDPSHAGGYAYLVEPMAKAAVMSGADGLMIEVHNDPENALSDGQQSLTPDAFDKLMTKIKKLVEMEDKHL